MPDQVLNLEFDKYSHGKQGCILDNVYVAPSTDGNSVNQLVPVPKIQYKPLNDFYLLWKVQSVWDCGELIFLYGTDDYNTKIAFYHKSNPSQVSYFQNFEQNIFGKLLEKEIITQEKHDKLLEWDSEAVFQAKPYWILSPISGTEKISGFGNLPSNNVVVVLFKNIMFAMFVNPIGQEIFVQGIYIKGELWYLSQDLNKMNDMRNLVSYWNTYNVLISDWSKDTENLFKIPSNWRDNINNSSADNFPYPSDYTDKDGLLYEAWAQLLKYDPKLSGWSVPMSQDIRNIASRYLTQMESGASTFDMTDKTCTHTMRYNYPNSSVNNPSPISYDSRGGGLVKTADNISKLNEINNGGNIGGSEVLDSIWKNTYRKYAEAIKNYPLKEPFTNINLNEIRNNLLTMFKAPADNDINQLFWQGDPEGVLKGIGNLSNYKWHGAGNYIYRYGLCNVTLTNRWMIYYNAAFANDSDTKPCNNDGTLRSDLIQAINSDQLLPSTRENSTAPVPRVVNIICNAIILTNRFLKSLENDLPIELSGIALESFLSVAQTTQTNLDSLISLCNSSKGTITDLTEILRQKLTPELFKQSEDYINQTSRQLDEIIKLARAARSKASEYANRSRGNILYSELNGIVVQMISMLADLWKELEWFQEGQPIKDLQLLMQQNNVDYYPKFFETLSSMLVVIASDNRFYYSNAGTVEIDADSFYSAQAGGGQSIPNECYRLGNRLLLTTKDTIEFWDITQNFDNPLSPQYGHKVYSYEILPGSVVIYDDVAYCLASSIKLPHLSIYRIAKNGDMQQISYPELDAIINKHINFISVTKIKTSLIELSKKPIIQFWIEDSVENHSEGKHKWIKSINYDISLNQFFLSEEILLYCPSYEFNETYDGFYINLNGTPENAIIGANITAAGDLEDLKNTVCEFSSPPLSLGREYKSLKLVRAEVINNGVKQLNLVLDRQDNHEFNTTRIVTFTGHNENRNMLAKFENLGLVNQNRTTLLWKGDLRISNIAWVVS